MTPEEAWKLHEQWLLSIDGNLDRISAELQASQSEFREALAAVNRSLANTNDALGIVAQNQSNFSAALVMLTRQAAEHREEFAAHVRESAEEHRRLREGLDRLERLIEQYIRSRGAGRS